MALAWPPELPPQRCLNLFWAWWCPLIQLAYPLVGRLWCAVCSLVFENRFWCRHLCPVGGMNGLFAKLSILELRAEAGTCRGSCTNYGCFKGGPAVDEGMPTGGCPLATHPAHLIHNRNGVLCLTCAQVCPHRSVQLRLRPLATDLQRDMEHPAGEPGLILVLLGGVCPHHRQRLLGWFPLAPALALPALLVQVLALVVAAPRQRQLLYALLLGRHLPLGLTEAGQVVPVTFAPLQLPWVELLPSWSADPHVIAFCQSAVVFAGVLGLVVLIHRLQTTGQRPEWISGTWRTWCACPT